MSQTRTDIVSVQIMRALAALFVAFLHTYVILSKPEYGSISAFPVLAEKGWIGVSLFFIISGFIITHVHNKDIGNPSAIQGFIWKRFIRIYPCYWLVLTAFIAATAFGMGHSDFKWEFLHLATAYSLIYLVDMAKMPLKVAWTLIFEVKFYMLFCLFIYSRRAMSFIVPAWALAIVIRNMFEPLPDWGYVLPDWGMLNIWNIYFLCGMGVWWCAKSLRPSSGGYILGLGIVALLAESPLIGNQDATALKPFVMMSLAIALSLIATGAILVEKQYKIRNSGLFVLLGNASYSIYLVHSTVISTLAQINFKLFYEKLNPEVLYILVFVMSVSAGVAFHLLFEKPILTFAKTLRHRKVRAGVAYPETGLQP